MQQIATVPRCAKPYEAERPVTAPPHMMTPEDREITEKSNSVWSLLSDGLPQDSCSARCATSGRAEGDAVSSKIKVRLSKISAT